MTILIDSFDIVTKLGVEGSGGLSGAGFVLFKNNQTSEFGSEISFSSGFGGSVTTTGIPGTSGNSAGVPRYDVFLGPLNYNQNVDEFSFEPGNILDVSFVPGFGFGFEFNKDRYEFLRVQCDVFKEDLMRNRPAFPPHN